jgi:methionyl aminopeptidase
LAEKLIRKAGAIPTFIGYHGYPSSICVSINEEVVHGMPSDRVIKEGDIVSVDIGATFDGYVGDTAYTFLVEPVSVEARKLVQATKESLDAAIEMMKPGKRLGDIGAAVQKFVEAKGYGVVRDFVGHGIGRQMHESPAVPNYGDAGSGMRLETGLVLAIEPMVTQGSHDVKVLKDGWTVVTKDGSLAAHFEHTVAVTDNGPWVLTAI